MNCVLLAQISMTPSEELFIPIYTPTNVGVVVFAPDPVHEMGPHVTPLLDRFELINVNEGEALLIYMHSKIIVYCIVN